MPYGCSPEAEQEARSEGDEDRGEVEEEEESGHL